jgi:hypothetical protein
MLLKRLLGAVKNIEKTIQGKNEAKTKATETTLTQQTVTPLVRADVNLPQGVEVHKATTDATDDKKYQFRTLFVAWFTFGALVIYAVISGWQLYEMRKATRATQCAAEAAESAAETASKQLEIASGAVIRLTRPPFSFTPNSPNSTSEPVVLWMNLSNIGHTTATHIHVHLEVSIISVPRGDKIDDSKMWDVEIPNLLRQNPDNSNDPDTAYNLKVGPPVAPSHNKPLHDGKEALKADIELHYFDGFQTVEESTCWGFVGTPSITIGRETVGGISDFLPCDQLSREIKNIPAQIANDQAGARKVEEAQKQKPN